MIQRIQSVYLLMTSLLSLLFLVFPFLTFFDNSGNAIALTFRGLEGTSSALISGSGKGFFIPVVILWISCGLVSLLTIFLFRNRGLQILFTKILLIILSVFIALLAVYIIINKSEFLITVVSAASLSIPVLQIVLTWLSLRAIKKDDDLVKSYDRIR